MRLAVLFHRLGPYHVARLRAAASAGRGEVVAVELSGSGGEYAWDRVEVSGFERVTVRPGGDSDGLPRAELVRRVGEALDRVRPGVLAVAGWSDKGMLAAAQWGLRRGVPMVLMSDSQFRDERRVWWKEFIKRRVVGCFSAGFVAGAPHADYLARLGMSRDRVSDGYDAVDNDHFARGADAARAGSDRLDLPERYFLCCARFVPKKDLPTLLNAYAAYRQTAGASAWGLVLVGDGPLRPDLEKQTRALGLSGRAVFAGFRQYDELPAYYGLASALVLPSVQEQWGLVANEAMAAGLPVLASSACGCVPDLVEPGVTGDVFEPGDAATLAGRMLHLSRDPAAAATLGEAARRRVAGWGLPRFCEGLWRAAETARRVGPAWFGGPRSVLLSVLAGRPRGDTR